jgi:hypothetical protein
VLALGGQRKVASLAAVFFVAGYAPQEAVTWIAAYVHVLTATFYLAALNMGALWVRLRRSWYFLGMLALILLGMATKEGILTAPIVLGILFAIDIWKRQLDVRTGTWVILVMMTLAVAYVAAMVFWQKAIHGASVESGVYRPGLHVVTNYRYLIGLVAPPPDYIPFVSFVRRTFGNEVLAIYSWTMWSMLVVLAFWFFWSVLRGDRIVRAAVVLLLISYAPFAMTTVGISTRYLYLSFAGFSILVADGLLRAKTLIPERVLYSLVVLIIVVNVGMVWTWQWKMNGNGRVRAQMIEQVIEKLGAVDNTHVQVCISGLPDKYSDVAMGIRVLSHRNPLPNVRLDDSNCQPSDHLDFFYDGNGLVGQGEVSY